MLILLKMLCQATENAVSYQAKYSKTSEEEARNLEKGKCVQTEKPRSPILNQSIHLVPFHLLSWTLWILFTPAEFYDSCPLGVHCTLNFVPGTETF